MSSSTHHRLPRIRIGEADYESLVRLANAALDRSPDVADELLSEIERAEIVDGRKLKPDVIRMGSRATYRMDEGEERTVTLVYPAQANIEEGRISILTPVGAALIGLKAGQSMPCRMRDGRQHKLTVMQVQPPEAPPVPAAVSEAV